MSSQNSPGIVGFIGLGAMGLPMAQTLLRGGYRVQGFDLNPAALAALVETGGVAAGSAAEAAAGAGTLVVMVLNVAQAEAVLFGAGAMAALPEGAAVVVMATCPPKAVQELAERVEATGRLYIDAPVSGGTVGATAGSLTIMAGAAPGAFAAVKPVLDTLGGKVVHVGERPGQGAAVKSINQLLAGVHIAAAAEALALAKKAGLDPALILDIVSTSAAGSWMLRDRGPRMLEREPQVSSAVDIWVKDLGITLEAGRDNRAATPLAALAYQLFLAASAQGLGAADDSQLVRTYDRLNGG